MKLNTDGCSKSNPRESGGGGVLRNDLGICITTFATYFGHLTSLQAEVQVLLVGVKLCLQQGFSIFHVQCNSMLVINILRKSFHCPWEVIKEFEEL